MKHPIVAEELELLEGVSSSLARPQAPKSDSESAIVRELERLRDLLFSGAESKDDMALRDQWHRQNSLLQQLRRSRGAPVVDRGSPYFGHLRLREGEAERDLCLGRATWVRDGVRIVDWRNAPISRVFYRYQQGEDYEEEFGGRVRAGVVVARRSVVIRDGALHQIEAPEGSFLRPEGDARDWQRLDREPPRLAGGEASALRAHAMGETPSGRLGAGPGVARRGADKRLPEITGLIDPAQFGLIAKPSSGFLVIRGTAGSGKTTVALHRIAFLAYDDPSIDSDRTLVTVFSPALRNYVSHVLPALGVDRVRIQTYHEWASDQRHRHFPSLPTGMRQDTPAVVQRLKLHPVLDSALESHVRSTPGPSTAEQALDDWSSVLLRESLLSEVCEREAPGIFSRGQIRAFVEWNRRAQEALSEHLHGEGDGQAELDPEDDTLLLRAWQLRVGPLRGRGRRPLRYRHVAVDEVQDFSPLEVRVLLGCLDERRCITLAGDTQQHLVSESGFTSWREFLGRLGVPGSEIETLRISYRSSQPIVEFARSVLGDLVVEEEPPIVTRSGPPVELFRFTDRGACVGFLADALKHLVRAEPLASVAVLTPSRESSALYYEGLTNSEVFSLRRVENQDFTFSPGVEVTEIEQVKGLEFDYVVVTEVSEDRFPDSPEARRLLHVAATRAVHQLWILSVGTPSSLLGPLDR